MADKKRSFFSTRSDRESEPNTIAIIGLGRFGRSIALELENQGIEVLGIDRNPEIVEEMAGSLTHVVCADSTKKDVLRNLGIDTMAKVVIAIGSRLEASILTASALLSIPEGPEVWAKASNEAQATIFSQMGIVHVFQPETDMGRRAAHLVVHAMHDYVDLGYGFAMVTMETPELLLETPLRDVGLRRSYGITVIAVCRDDVWTPANRDTVLSEGENILIVGPSKNLGELGV